MNALGVIFFTIIFLFSLSGSSEKQTILFDQLAEIEYVDTNKNGRDDISSVSRPILELKGFKKIFLKKGETKTVEFEISPEELRFFDRNMNEVVEPGKYIIYVGKSSIDLKSVELNVI